MRIPREVMYHAKDSDKTAIYMCPDCFHGDKKHLQRFEEWNVFCQQGSPVTTPYVCSECEKEKRCLRFSPA